MAIFGNRSARRRRRRAARQARSIPAFQIPADCTPWVLDGLWPAELHQGRPETAAVAEYLRNDLHRIADSANQKLREIADAGLAEPIRQVEETRIVNVARAFAVLRVESTIRLLRREPLGFRSEYLSLGAVPDEPTQVVTRADRPEPTVVIEHHETPPRAGSAGQARAAPAQTATALLDEDPLPQAESAEARLRRLLGFVARQEPRLAWGVADRSDGTTILVTDLAHGWLPPGIEVPAGVELLPPQRRSEPLSKLRDLIGRTVTYRPGDAFAAKSEPDVTAPSTQARMLDTVPDLDRQLGEATQWRDGLPRMVHSMAKGGAAGTVVPAELDVLRVHLDTARYQLYGQYPDGNDRLLCNCLLLAATEAIASGDRVGANYHFSWFLELTAGKADGWAQTADRGAADAS